MINWFRNRLSEWLSFLKSAEFDGYYVSFADVPDIGLGHDDENLTDSYVRKGLDSPSQCLENENAPGLHRLIKLVENVSGNVHILDFGGGYGTVSAALYEEYPDEMARFKITLCETPSMIKSLKKHYAPEAIGIDMKMVESVDPSSRYDFIYVGSSLQYLENYTATLRLFSEITSDIIFDDLPTSNLDSFVARQINYVPAFPAWVFSKNEITTFFESAGFFLKWDKKNPRKFVHRNAPIGLARESNSFLFSLG